MIDPKKNLNSDVSIFDNNLGKIFIDELNKRTLDKLSLKSGSKTDIMISLIKMLFNTLIIKSIIRIEG